MHVDVSRGGARLGGELEATMTDGLVLVLEAGETRREAAQAAVSSLRAANVPILGAVLNNRELPIPEKLYRNL